MHAPLSERGSGVGGGLLIHTDLFRTDLFSFVFVSVKTFSVALEVPI